MGASLNSISLYVLLLFSFASCKPEMHCYTAISRCTTTAYYRHCQKTHCANPETTNCKTTSDECVKFIETCVETTGPQGCKLPTPPSPSPLPTPFLLHPSTSHTGRPSHSFRPPHPTSSLPHPLPTVAPIPKTHPTPTISPQCSAIISQCEFSSEYVTCLESEGCKNPKKDDCQHANESCKKTLTDCLELFGCA